MNADHPDAVEPPPTVTPEHVAAVRRALEGLRVRWRRFDAKGTLTLSFRPDEPEAGFADIAEPALASGAASCA